MPCGKEQYVEVGCPEDLGVVQELCNQVMQSALFGFPQVDIHALDDSKERFSEFCPWFVVDTILEETIPRHMKEYQERTGQKTILGTRKLLGIMSLTKHLLYVPLLQWYLSHSLKVTAIHKYLEYKLGRPFWWFPEEVSQVRHNSDNNTALKQLGDTFKLKGNSFYMKMIEDLVKQERMTFTTNEDLVNQFFRSPLFEDLEDIHGTFEIRECKRRVNITQPYQCSIAIYQLAKLHMLEFYYNCLDKYLDQRDFDLIQMDTNLLYIAILGMSINEVVKPELEKEYDHGGKATFLSTSKYHNRTLGLFNAEFQGTRMITLMSKCYYAKDAKSQSVFSCKSVRKSRTPCLGRDIWELSMEASMWPQIQASRFITTEL